MNQKEAGPRAKVKLELLPPKVSDGLAEKGGVDGLKDTIPLAQIDSNVPVFQALSDKNRLIILLALNTGDLCPCVLADLTEQSNSRLSYHLNMLEKEGLISVRSEGKWRIFSLTDKARGILENFF